MEQSTIGNRNNIVKYYPNEHYKIMFDQRNGFFARIEDKGFNEPFWSQHGPELLDVSITNWCDKDCTFCYRCSNTHGKHISLSDYVTILDQAKSLDVFQIALGGGNPNQHPDFVKILSLTRSDYAIIPSYTTNGRGLTKEILTASKEYCGAVAVSAYEPYNEFYEALELLLKYGVKTNIHFLLDANSIGTAIKWLTEKPSFIKDVNAIIFLNYKPIGKYGDCSLLLNKSERLKNFFDIVSSNKFSFKIGFDSCSVPGIVKYLNVKPMFYEACEAARFSAFISEDLTMYPCSFMIHSGDKANLKEQELKDIWREGLAFKTIRDRIKYNDCDDCNHEISCLGGCPFLPEINLCN